MSELDTNPDRDVQGHYSQTPTCLPVATNDEGGEPKGSPHWGQLTQDYGNKGNPKDEEGKAW